MVGIRNGHAHKSPPLRVLAGVDSLCSQEKTNQLVFELLTKARKVLIGGRLAVTVAALRG